MSEENQLLSRARTKDSDSGNTALFDPPTQEPERRVTRSKAKVQAAAVKPSNLSVAPVVTGATMKVRQPFPFLRYIYFMIN